MKTENRIKLGTSNLEVSKVALGLMRISAMTEKDVAHLLNTAIEHGINYFDTADVYGNGRTEELLGKSYTGKREDIFIQTKVGISTVPDKSEGSNTINTILGGMRATSYQFSKEHILKSVDESLKRLNTDYVDMLLLHRPDALSEPEEVASAFDSLHKSGKVKNFGVSNHTPMQISLLKRYLTVPIIVNQLQFSLANTQMIDFGLHMNTKFDSSINRDGEVLDYCRLNDISVQTWSPFQYGFIEGIFLDSPLYKNLNSVIHRLAKEKNVPETAIVVDWILRHPAHMQVVVGTTNAERLSDITQFPKVQMTHDEWYELYVAAGNDII